MNKNAVRKGGRVKNRSSAEEINHHVARARLLYWLLAILLGLGGFAAWKTLWVKYKSSEGTSFELQLSSLSNKLVAIDTLTTRVDSALADPNVSFKTKRAFIKMKVKLSSLETTAKMLLAQGQDWKTMPDEDRQAFVIAVHEFLENAADEAGKYNWEAVVRSVTNDELKIAMVKMEKQLKQASEIEAKLRGALAASEASHGSDREKWLNEIAHLRDSLEGVNGTIADLDKRVLGLKADSTGTRMKLDAVDQFRVSDVTFSPSKLKGKGKTFKLGALKDGLDVEFKLDGVAPWVKSDSVHIRIDIRMPDSNREDRLTGISDDAWLVVGKHYKGTFTLENVRAKIPDYSWARGQYNLIVSERTTGHTIFSTDFTVGLDNK